MLYEVITIWGPYLLPGANLLVVNPDKSLDWSANALSSERRESLGKLAVLERCNGQELCGSHVTLAAPTMNSDLNHPEDTQRLTRWLRQGADWRTRTNVV